MVLLCALRAWQHLTGRFTPPDEAANLDPVCDIVLAMQWTKRHIAEYGGDSERVFLVGYSSGGHAVALFALATIGDGVAAPSVDPRWAKALRECGVNAPPGVVLISGIFDLRSFGKSGAAGSGADGWVMRLFSVWGRQFIGDVFGLRDKDIEERLEEISPLAQVEKWTPPAGKEKLRFVFLSSKNELFGLSALEKILFSPSPKFAAKLRQKGVVVDELLHGNNHWQLALGIAEALRPVLGTPPFSN